MSWLQEEWGFTEEDILRLQKELRTYAMKDSKDASDLFPPQWGKKPEYYGYPEQIPVWLPFVEEGGWTMTPATEPKTPAVPATPNLKQIEEYIDFLKQQKQQAVSDHYRKEKEKGLVMDLAAHFGLKVKFVEGAEGDHTQPPTKAS